MKKLTPIELEDGTVIYMEVQDDIEIVSEEAKQEEGTRGLGTRELTRGDIGGQEKGRGIPIPSPQEQIRQNFAAIEGTITNYTNHTLNAFRKIGSRNIDKVTLEFGIKVGGRAGIPYVTEGSADCHLKIVVQCCFPDNG